MHSVGDWVASGSQKPVVTYNCSSQESSETISHVQVRRVTVVAIHSVHLLNGELFSCLKSIPLLMQIDHHNTILRLM